MTSHEINNLVEQFLQKNTVKIIPQSTTKKHNLPTFEQSFKYRGGLSGSLIS